MKKLLKTSIVLSVLLSSSSFVLASDGLDQPYLNDSISQPTTYDRLYSHYMPKDVSWDFFHTLKETGQAKLEGKTYTADQTELYDALPGKTRSFLCSLGKKINIRTTTDTFPHLRTNMMIQNAIIEYDFAYQVEKTLLYKGDEAGFYHFKIRPILTMEDQKALSAQINTDADQLDHVAGMAFSFDEVKNMLAELRQEKESIHNEDEHFIISEENLDAPQEDADSVNQSEEKAFRKRDILSIASKYISREQAISKAISELENAIIESSSHGKAVVIVANTAANLFGYNRAAEIAVERATGLDRRNTGTTLSHVSTATWHLASYFLPGVNSLHYVSNAVANVSLGADSVTQGVFGEKNDRTVRQNRLLAATNVVKAGVSLVPMGGVLIAVSGVAAKYVLNEESLTAFVVHKFHKEVMKNSEKSERLDFHNDLERVAEVIAKDKKASQLMESLTSSN